jgi:F0F1-type ATP synthase membrane subunit b/b'
MLNKLWSIFLKALWPLLWPVIRDNMVEVVQDLATWLRRVLADRFNATTQKQQERAQERARDAQQQADRASTDEERIQANAKAEAWREIADQLRKDNEELKQQLEEAIRASQNYARKRIDSEAEQNRVQEKVQSLKPPSDSDSFNPKQTN